MTRRSFMESGDPQDLRPGDKVRISYLGLESPELATLTVGFDGDLMAGAFTVSSPEGVFPVATIVEHEPHEPPKQRTVTVDLPTIPSTGYTLTTARGKIVVVHSDGLVGIASDVGECVTARPNRDQLRDLAAHILAAAEGMEP